MPKGIQRKRSKGWRKPEGAVYVGRPTVWGNKFIVGRNGMTAEDAVRFYEATLPIELIKRARRELRGRDLMDWCPLDRPCHRNVLLRIANE
jgi:hypothetical protein